MLDSCFSDAMKNCALPKAPLRYIFFTVWFFASENSDERVFLFFAKIIKLTNSLVEPRTYKLWHSLYAAASSDKKHLNFSKYG